MFAVLQTQFPGIGNGFSNSLDIHDVEGIEPIVLFIKKKLSTHNYQNIYMGGRTHNFILRMSAETLNFWLRKFVQKV